MLQLKYFSYGSNINYQRILNRLGYVERGIPFTLNNFKLVFNVGQFDTFANIIPQQNESVLGILYDLTDDQLTQLSKYEAFYEKRYFQIDSNTIGVYFVGLPRMINHRRNLKPPLEYLNVILDGCLDYKLDNLYHELLSFKEQNYKLKRSKHKRR